MIYRWKIEGITPISAQVAGEELERIYKRDGVIEPETVVEENSTPSAPLYSCFEWDDTTAAHRYRVSQAQKIIRAIVKVEELEKPCEVRAFVNVQSEYHPIRVVMQDDKKRAALLEMAMRELRAFQRKYSTLEELADVFKAIEGVKV